MMGLEHEIAIQILANLLSTVIIAVLGVVAFIVAETISRGRLFSLFGISRIRRRLTCYVSLLKVEQVRGFEEMTKGYIGDAINMNEYRGAVTVVDQFESKLLAVLPNKLREISSGLFLSWLPVQPKIETSPETEAFQEGENVLVIGCSPYNLLARHILDSDYSFFEFAKVDGHRTFKSKRRPEIVTAVRADSRVEYLGTALEDMKGRTGDPNDNHEQGVIQRIRMPLGGHSAPVVTVILCAGLGSNSTMNTARYLAINYPTLVRKHRNNDFGMLLTFRQGSPDEREECSPAQITTIRALPRVQVKSERADRRRRSRA